ncbi:MAG: alpha/beta hydrolase [Thermoactinomyces sp.]
MARPTCIWISGWSAAKEIWLPFVEVFPGHNHLLLDFLSCRSQEDLVKELHRHAMGVKGPVIIVGWSLGAMVALKWLETEAARVKQAFLIGGALQFVRKQREDYGWDDRVLRKMIRQLQTAPEKVVAQFDRRMFSEQEQHAGIAGAWRNPASPLPSPEALEAGLQFLREYRFSPSPESKNVPVRLLFGEEDSICRPEPKWRWAEAFHQVQITVWENTGHVPFFSQPNLFRKWLQSGGDSYE